jgi:hypothetical protein
MRTKVAVWCMALSILAPVVISPLVKADVTSPEIKDRGKRYTPEKPLINYYGTGSSARLTEASELRLAVEDLIAGGEWEAAIPKAKKAVQLDPGDPSGHLFLARVLTMKFYETKGKVDEKLLAECVREWQLIRYHDADPNEQWEAGQQVKKLMKIAKTLEKEKMAMEKEKELNARDYRNESVARKSSPTVSDSALAGSVPGTDSKPTAGTSPDDPSKNKDARPIAGKKRLFGFI